MYKPDVWKREWGYRYKFGSGKHIKNEALGGHEVTQEERWGWRGKAIHDGALETPTLVARPVRRNQ